MAAATHAAVAAAPSCGVRVAARADALAASVAEQVGACAAAAASTPPGEGASWDEAMSLGGASLRAVAHFGAVGSTQTVASELCASGSPDELDGVALVADLQTAGRGRSSHRWDSPPESSGLLVSLIRSVPAATAGKVLPLAQHVASLAALRAVAAACAGPAAPGASARSASREGTAAPAPRMAIKWPNDLYVVGALPPAAGPADGAAGAAATEAAGGSGAAAAAASDVERALERHCGAPVRKAGGILCTVAQPTGRARGGLFLVIGMGLNLSDAPPGRGAVADVHGRTSDPALLRQRVLGHFCREVDSLWRRTVNGGGSSAWRDEYERAWMHAGQRVKLPGGEWLELAGLAETGGLVATDGFGGPLVELGTGNDTVDLMDGLVRVGKPQ